LSDEDHSLRRFESGDLGLHIGDHVGFADVRARRQRGHGGDGLTERVVVDAHDEAVDHPVDALDRLLDLLGEDLLAPRVDDVAAATEQDQRAVRGDLSHVARERVPGAVHLAERPRRLLRILVVAQRDQPAVGHGADLSGAWLHFATVVGEHLARR